MTMLADNSTKIKEFLKDQVGQFRIVTAPLVNNVTFKMVIRLEKGKLKRSSPNLIKVTAGGGKASISGEEYLHMEVGEDYSDSLKAVSEYYAKDSLPYRLYAFLDDLRKQ